MSIEDFLIDSVDESYYKQLIAEIANKMRKKRYNDQWKS